MSEDDARLFIRGLGCPRCWAQPATQQSDQEGRFLHDLMRLKDQIDCRPGHVLDALAELGGRR
jgi:hypothetical protein